MTEPIRQIGLTSDVPELSFEALEQVADALDHQASRDLGPIWGVHATVRAFRDAGSVPPGYWPLVVVRDLARARGCTATSADGRTDWSSSARCGPSPPVTSVSRC